MDDQEDYTTPCTHTVFRRYGPAKRLSHEDCGRPARVVLVVRTKAGLRLMRRCGRHANMMVRRSPGVILERIADGGHIGNACLGWNDLQAATWRTIGAPALADPIRLIDGSSTRVAALEFTFNLDSQTFDVYVLDGRTVEVALAPASAVDSPRWQEVYRQKLHGDR